jgi:hypothetical protein
MSRTKADFFDLLNSGQLYQFPETDKEIEWFDEWLETTPQGKKHSKKSGELMDKIHINGYFQLFFIKAFFREQIDDGVTEFRVKLIDDRHIEIIPCALKKPYKNKYNSHFIKL